MIWNLLKKCQAFRKIILVSIQMGWKRRRLGPVLRMHAILPPLWQDFLNDILQKIDPLSPQSDMRIFRLSDLNINDGQELITLMARDAVLNKYILKTEDYHIAIRSANLLKVKKRLEEFGYFITQLR